MKFLAPVLGFVLALAATPACAQTGFYLPTATTTYGQDEFRAADGTTCRTTMDGTKRIELGAFGSGGRTNGDPYALPGYSYPNQGNAGVYGRFSMSLDASPERMNCNALYKLELERRTLEVEIMKRSLISADRELDELKDSRAGEPPTPPATTATAQKAAAKPSKAATARRSFPPP